MSPCLYNIYTYRESYSLALRSIPLYLLYLFSSIYNSRYTNRCFCVISV